jgi:hypothetical protein
MTDTNESPSMQDGSSKDPPSEPVAAAQMMAIPPTAAQLALQVGWIMKDPPSEPLTAAPMTAIPATAVQLALEAG